MITLLSILVFISAGLFIWGKYNFHKNKYGIYIFKPLTTILIIIIAILASNGLKGNYKYFIYGALFFSLLGDIILLTRDKFLYGLLSFFIAHVIFTCGFYYLSYSFHLWLMIIFALAAIAIFIFLLPSLGKYKYPVLVYALAICTMAWRAWEYFLNAGSPGSLIIAIAALLFLISDGNFAFNRFRKPYKAAEFIILSTYFLSIWLMAIAFAYMKQK
jgi:uncharacterized membrane protein YhhN